MFYAFDNFTNFHTQSRNIDWFIVGRWRWSCFWFWFFLFLFFLWLFFSLFFFLGFWFRFLFLIGWFFLWFLSLLLLWFWKSNLDFSISKFQSSQIRFQFFDDFSNFYITWVKSWCRWNWRLGRNRCYGKTRVGFIHGKGEIMVEVKSGRGEIRV